MCDFLDTFVLVTYEWDLNIFVKFLVDTIHKAVEVSLRWTDSAVIFVN